MDCAQGVSRHLPHPDDRSRPGGRAGQHPNQAAILVSNHAFVSDAFVLALVFGQLHTAGPGGGRSPLPFFGWLLASRRPDPGCPRPQGRRLWHGPLNSSPTGETVLIYPEGRLGQAENAAKMEAGASRLAL